MTADGWQQLFHHRCQLQHTLRQQYALSLLPHSTGWDSLPPQHFPIGHQLQIEALLLGQAFSHFLSAIPPLDYQAMPPALLFCQASFTNPSQQSYIATEFPDLSDIFGDQAPTTPKTYSTTCQLQCHSGTDYTICLDTGCTLSSTSSLDDFEEPPIHGCFGHLQTINHVVPIEAAGMIWWHVLDMEGQPAVILTRI